MVSHVAWIGIQEESNGFGVDLSNQTLVVCVRYDQVIVSELDMLGQRTCLNG